MTSRLSRIMLLLVVLAVSPLFAGILTNGSQLNVTGDELAFNFIRNVPGIAFLTFLCDQPDPQCVAPPANKGDFGVGISTGSFAQYNGRFGLITDLDGTAQPLNTVFSLPNFMTFTLNNQITIELTFIPLGHDTASATCAGLISCTPQNPALVTPNDPEGLSAFNLDENGTGTVAVFGVSGIAHASDGSTASLSGTFSSNFTDVIPQVALSLMLAGSSQPYQANLSLSTAVPEPVSTLMVGLGLLSLMFLGIRQRGNI